MSHPPCGWWWLSFTDPDLPPGSQFLGAVVVQPRLLPGIGGAVLQAHHLKINPGGQVVGVLIPDEHVPDETFRNRLLSRAEAESL